MSVTPDSKYHGEVGVLRGQGDRRRVAGTMDLKVVDTEPDRTESHASAVMRPRKLETGLTIQVPPFVNHRRPVKVDTSEARYVQAW